MRHDIDPRKWGPALWTAMHSIAAAYDPDEVSTEQVTAFLNSLTVLLPCGKCREHWGVLMKDFPVTEWLESRETFFTWTLKVRDMVTQQNTSNPNKKGLDHNLMRTRYNLPTVGPRSTRALQTRQVVTAASPPAAAPVVRAPAKPLSHQPAVTTAGRASRGLFNSRSAQAPSRFSQPTTKSRAVSRTVQASVPKLTAVRSAAYTSALAKFQSLKEKKGCKSCGRRR